MFRDIAYNFLSIFSSSGSENKIVLENIINSLPSRIFWKDRRSYFLGCNKAFALDAGLQNTNDIIGKTDYEMPWKAYAKQYIQDDAYVIGSKKNKPDYEEKHIRFDGVERTMLVTKVPMLDPEENVIGLLGIYTDITEMTRVYKELEEYKHKADSSLRDKLAFIQNISHDLRIPFSGILGVAELLKLENDAKISSMADIIVKSGSEFLSFINDLLDRLNNDDYTDAMINFDLKELVQKIIDINLCKTYEKNVSVQLQSDDFRPNFRGPYNKLFRILFEVITNAFNFSNNNGCVKIAIKTCRKEDGNIVVRIEIEDNGEGVSDETHKGIFSRFSKKYPSGVGVGSSEYKGSGLGLYSAKRLIEEIKGEIHLESQAGNGTKFICIFPLMESIGSK